MAQLIYLLCALTSLGCTVLLVRQYRRSRVGLLFWSAAGFLAFTVTNILLFVDLVIVPTVDLSIVRNSITMFGVLVLLLGLIKNST